MQQSVSKNHLAYWWIPCLGAISCFAAGITLDEPAVLLLPFVVLAIIFFIRNLCYLFFTLLFAIPLSTEFSVTETLSTDLPDEPMMLLLAFSLLLLIAIKPRLLPQEIMKSGLALLLIVQLIWMLIAVLYSHEIWLSTKYFLAKLWFILAFVLGGVLFLRTKDDLKLASKALIFSMLIPVVISLVRHASKGFSFESINSTLDPFFRNHVNYSALMVCLFPILLMWYYFSSRPFRKWIMVCMVVFIAALFFAYSRGAWLCVVTGFITWLAVKYRFLLSLIFAALLIAGASLFWLIQHDNYLKFAPDFNTTTQHTDFNEHIEATYTLKDMSTMERFYRWIAGIKMLDEEKMHGFGPNSFTTYYKEHTVTAFKTWVSNNEEKSSVHNYFLLIAIEQGLPAVVILIVLLIYMYAIAIKAYHTLQDPFDRSLAMLCAVVLSMIVTLNLLSDLIETDKIGSLYFLIIGLLIRLQVKVNEQKKQTEML